MRPAITFDNQLSTGIQAFGHCGSPTCCMTSSFGANPEESVLAVTPAVTPDAPAAPAPDQEANDRGATALMIGLAVYIVSISIIFTKKYHDYTK